MLCQRYTRLIINLNLRKTNSLKFNECYGNTIIKFKRFSIWSLGSRNYLVLYSFKYLLCVARCLKWRLCRPESSVKWSDPGHFLGSQGNFFLSFPCTLFLHVFDTQNYRWDPKKFPGSLHFTLLSFLQYINNYLGLSNFYTYMQYLNNYSGQLSTYAIFK